MTTQMTLVDGPVTFTEPSSPTRFYNQPALVSINGQIDVVDAYQDPDQGNVNLQPQTYVGYTITASGAVSQNSGFVNWINALGPQAVPATTLNYSARVFNGSSSESVFGEYFDTVNGNGTATFRLAAVDTAGNTPVIHQVADTITVTPVPKNLSDNVVAELGNLADGNSLNEQIFEVEGAPNPGEVQGTFLIFNSSGTVIVGPSTGFDFTDGKAHTFTVGASGTQANTFIEAVEVWNPNTNLADLQIRSIDATTGAVTLQGTLATEFGNFERLDFKYVGNPRMPPRSLESAPAPMLPERPASN